MDVDKQVRLILSFHRDRLEKMIFIEGNGRELPALVVDGATNETEIPWREGTMGVILGILHYKLLGGTASSIYEFLGPAKGTPEASARHTRDTAPWFKELIEQQPTAFRAFAKQAKRVIRRRQARKKTMFGISIVASLLPTANIVITRDSREVGQQKLFDLYESIYEQWRNGRETVRLSEASPNRVKLRLSQLAPESVTPVPKIPSNQDLSWKKRYPARWNSNLCTSRSGSHKPFSGRWTFNEVCALFERFVSYPRDVNQCWGFNDDSLFWHLPQSHSKEDIQGTLLSVQVLRAIVGENFLRVAKPCGRWWLANLHDRHEGNHAWNSIDVNTAALATLFCCADIGDAEQKQHRSLILRKIAGGTIASPEFEDAAMRSKLELQIYQSGFLASWELRSGGTDISVINPEEFIKMLSDVWRSRCPGDCEPNVAFIRNAVWLVFPLIFQERSRSSISSDQILSSILFGGGSSSSPRFRAFLSLSDVYNEELYPAYKYSPIDRFRLACRMAALIRILHSALEAADQGPSSNYLALGSSGNNPEGDLDEVCRLYRMFLDDWVIRSRALCTELTLPLVDLGTTLFLLISLAPLDQYREVAAANGFPRLENRPVHRKPEPVLIPGTPEPPALNIARLSSRDVSDFDRGGLPF